MAWVVVWRLNERYGKPGGGIERIFSTKEKALDYCKKLVDYTRKESDEYYCGFTFGNPKYYVVKKVAIS